MCYGKALSHLKGYFNVFWKKYELELKFLSPKKTKRIRLEKSTKKLCEREWHLQLGEMATVIFRIRHVARLHRLLSVTRLEKH